MLKRASLFCVARFGLRRGGGRVRRWIPALRWEAVGAGLLAAASTAGAEPWARHTIDRSSRGADGVRLADVNGDGHTDLTTGWEEGGAIRVYLNPGPDGAKKEWPAVTVGEVAAPEDAAFADLDGDGATDVLSCAEGGNRTVYVHWAPEDPDHYLDPEAWETEPIPATQGQQKWMFALPMQIDGKHGIDVVLGSKGDNASVGWLQAPAEPRDLEGWKFHRLYDAGWVMSLEPADVNGDGHTDVVLSDRYGANRAARWLENPGPEAAQSGERWPQHLIGGAGRHLLFLGLGDLDGDGAQDVVNATRGGVMLWFRRVSEDPVRWETHELPSPLGIRVGKAASVADINLDGRADIVHTANTGVDEEDRDKPGVTWAERSGELPGASWRAHDISGEEGKKFDLIRLLDLDRDGDLDVVTCEERDNLGVFWYENPTR